eukprot:GHVT01105059.1.p1 GENE.GHVT01105059.1~~GHVT01105059.1.p1  ORF type:complete len:198 (+),score=40.82 GHVT01105059.1:748-1341(+)
MASTKGDPEAKKSILSEAPLTPEEVKECIDLLEKDGGRKSSNAFLADRLGRRLAGEEDEAFEVFKKRCEDNLPEMKNLDSNSKMNVSNLLKPAGEQLTPPRQNAVTEVLTRWRSWFFIGGHSENPNSEIVEKVKPKKVKPPPTKDVIYEMLAHWKELESAPKQVRVEKLQSSNPSSDSSNQEKKADATNRESLKSGA